MTPMNTYFDGMIILEEGLKIDIKKLESDTNISRFETDEIEYNLIMNESKKYKTNEFMNNQLEKVEKLYSRFIELREDNNFNH